MSPALAGGSLTTGPPGQPCSGGLLRRLWMCPARTHRRPAQQRSLSSRALGRAQLWLLGSRICAEYSARDKLLKASGSGDKVSLWRNTGRSTLVGCGGWAQLAPAWHAHSLLLPVRIPRGLPPRTGCGAPLAPGDLCGSPAKPPRDQHARSTILTPALHLSCLAPRLPCGAGKTVFSPQGPCLLL